MEGRGKAGGGGTVRLPSRACAVSPLQPEEEEGPLKVLQHQKNQSIVKKKKVREEGRPF